MPNKQLYIIRLGLAIKVAASIDMHDSARAVIHLSALSSLILRLWESIVEHSEYHQDILAAIDNAVRYCRDLECPTNGQITAIRVALTYLGKSIVSQEEAKVVRERFVDVGIGALSFLDKCENGEE